MCQLLLYRIISTFDDKASSRSSRGLRNPIMSEFDHVILKNHNRCLDLRRLLPETQTAKLFRRRVFLAIGATMLLILSISLIYLSRLWFLLLVVTLYGIPRAGSIFIARLLSKSIANMVVCFGGRAAAFYLLAMFNQCGYRLSF